MTPQVPHKQVRLTPQQVQLLRETAKRIQQNLRDAKKAITAEKRRANPPWWCFWCSRTDRNIVIMNFTYTKELGQALRRGIAQDINELEDLRNKFVESPDVGNEHSTELRFIEPHSESYERLYSRANSADKTNFLDIEKDYYAESNDTVWEFNKDAAEGSTSLTVTVISDPDHAKIEYKLFNDPDSAFQDSGKETTADVTGLSWAKYVFRVTLPGYPPKRNVHDSRNTTTHVLHFSWEKKGT